MKETQEIITNSNELNAKIISVRQLVELNNLTIPDYQRPYRWSVKNVNQLIDDILLHSDSNKSAYRLGTLVLHREPDKLNIVDGQQRTITILLILKALKENSSQEMAKEMEKHNLKLPKVELFERLKLTHTDSKNNVYNNYKEIIRRIVDFDLKKVRFFLEKCEVVKVVLDDVSEAFQFFDSQNARGRDLEPHDLLKAFHLREFSNCVTDEDKHILVANWEALETDELKMLFAQILFRVRHWAKGMEARFFTKDHIDTFKGINPKSNGVFPYAEIYKISHYFVQDYNSSYHRSIDEKHIVYPFQLNQVMINGERFFEFVDYYWGIRQEILEHLKKYNHTHKIINVLDTYPQRNRTGDKYVRNLFDCALLFYWDKFGDREIIKATEKLFVWAYSLRLKQFAVQVASIDNYALGVPDIFRVIDRALHPREVLNLSIPFVHKTEIKGSRLDNIIELFKELHYYED